MPNAPTSALEGLTVLDITRGMAGALGTMFLCDHGARVIRVENTADPEAEPQVGYRVWNRGKESLELDLSNALAGVSDGGSAELDVFDKLLSKADVLVETFRPGSSYQALAGYDRTRTVNPRIVHCSLTGYGRHGPLKDKEPDGNLVMARTGIQGGAPTFRPGPSYVSHPMPDVNAALMAAEGVVAALLAREKTGAGRLVETSLYGGALVPASQFWSEGKEALRFGAGNPAGGMPFYSVFECKDGEYIQIACIHSGFAEVAAAVMGIYKRVTDSKYQPSGFRADRQEDRDEVFRMVVDTMKTRPASEWERIFEEADVPFMRARTVEEGMDDPQVRHNGMVVELDDPEVGTITGMGLPLRLSETPARIKGPAPLSGQHTESILDELANEPSPATTPAPQPTGELDYPLAGIKVLEISNVIAGPVVGKYLTELGADVIKMEPLTGEISRAGYTRFFLSGNSNKRSIALNASSDQGREVARRIAANVDIVTANLRPGAIARMGVDREGMKTANPGLIESYVTAFGPDGPYEHRPGLDPLAQALTGLQRNQGGPDHPPVFLGWQAPTDYAAGGMAALGAVLGLFVKERTGVAQSANTNLLNAGAVVNGEGFLKYDGKPPRRLAQDGAYGLSSLHRMFETTDGWVYVIAEQQEPWLGLCTVLELGLAQDPRFTTEEARQLNNNALSEELTPVFKRLSSADALGRLEKAGVPCAPVVEGQIPGFYDDPHTVANGLAAEYQHPAWGRSRYSGALVKFSDTRPFKGRPTPLLGEHTREVLAEAGYDEDEIDRLYREGIVTTESPDTS